MTKNSYKWLWTSMMLAVPFLGGAHECEGHPPPEPEPEYCFADDECGPGAYCNTDECLSPCREGETCPAVCYGICEPAPPPPEPPLCLDDSECGADERCNFDRCMAPPCDGDEGHLTVCYGVCEPAPICPAVLCALYCEFGMATDDSGCETCTCNPPPPACEPVLCDIYCEFGHVTDDRGCPVCECLPPPPERSCGGFAGLTCADDEYCEWDDTAAACGAADHLGTCRPRPEACYEIYAPVCGCDGVTYSNDCVARAAGTDIWGAGTCEGPPPGTP